MIGGYDLLAVKKYDEYSTFTYGKMWVLGWAFVKYVEEKGHIAPSRYHLVNKLYSVTGVAATNQEYARDADKIIKAVVAEVQSDKKNEIELVLKGLGKLKDLHTKMEKNGAHGKTRKNLENILIVYGLSLNTTEFWQQYDALIRNLSKRQQRISL